MLAPSDIAKKSIEVGVTKAKLKTSKILLLSFMAGIFIALAGVGATIGGIYGGKLASALIFPIGLAMVIIAGSELFTGNNLMISAWLKGKISGCKLLKNWLLVFFGNLLGALFITFLVVYSGVLDNIQESIIATATAKVNLSFMEAFIRGVLCNLLVCIAVWMAFSATSAGGKIAALFGPVFLFVLAGFEHCIANMFFIPAGIFLGGKLGIATENLNFGTFFTENLLPVTLGNIVGGAILVGLVYYLIYSRKQK